jgi:hypothetical protein
MSSPAWTTPVVIAASAFLAPLLGRALSRAFPPQHPAWDQYETLRRRYTALELSSQLAAMVAGIGAICFLIAVHAANTPWLVAVVFGWLALAPVLLIALFTVPRGVSCWRDFWRFYELRYRISLRFLTPLYVLLCLLGVISTTVVLHRL